MYVFWLPFSLCWPQWQWLSWRYRRALLLSELLDRSL
jgi:hypothetical protein